jgi:hypothetical protein
MMTLMDPRIKKYPEFVELWKEIPIIKKNEFQSGYVCPLCGCANDHFDNDIEFFKFDDDLETYLCLSCFYEIRLSPQILLNKKDKLHKNIKKNGIEPEHLFDFLMKNQNKSEDKMNDLIIVDME